MPRIIPLFRATVPEDGAIVRREVLRNQVRAHALTREAQRRARDIVEEAQAQADAIARRAQAHGYASGLVASADALADYLASHAELATRIREAAAREAEALLRDCISRPDVIDAALQQTLAERVDAKWCVEVLLPNGLAHLERPIERMSESRDGQIPIQYWDGDAILLRAGEHVFELSVADAVNDGVDKVMGKLPSTYALSGAHAQACRERIAALLGEMSTGRVADGAPHEEEQ